ncbi:flavin monoamine oxidase family protein [Propionibacteriaceae bacterium G1746]|uniref:flavin monoamine oxidase family protein n=1 Tax=Aestuariimicrobium sp. G57 TaxID=3418485 RepID=UPI003C28C31B
MLDCAIIGAGLAGLVAATELADRGRNIVVFEARDRVGGRVESAQLATGDHVDLGGQWVADLHTRMLALVHRMDLNLIGTSRGDITVKLGGVVATVPSQEEIEASLNPFEVADLGQGLARFRRLAERIARDKVWAEGNATWLNQLLRRWVHSNLRTPGGQAWFSRVFEGAFGVQFNDVTLGESLHRANSGVDMEALVAVNGGVNQQRVVEGMAEVPRRLAEALGDRVKLGHEVVGIDSSGDFAVVSLADGSTVKARTVIVALPPKLAVALDYNPPLERWRAETAARVPTGSIIKAVARYPRPWWHDAGFSGQMGSDAGPVRVLFDVSNSADGAGLLIGFFGAGDQENLSDRTPGLREAALSQVVTAAFGDGPAMQEYVERDWRAERFTGGCHGAHFAPGVWTASGPALAEPHGLVTFAGAEFAPRFNGYMEGAVRSGQEAAAAVGRELG